MPKNKFALFSAINSLFMAPDRVLCRESAPENIG
jgi:hypothetical protein